MRCAVFSCSSDNQSKDFRGKIRFYSFPKNTERKKIWVAACYRNNKFNPVHSRVCSKHFREDDYERNMKYELLNYLPKGGKKLKSTAVPSLHLPNGGGIKTFTSQLESENRDFLRNSPNVIGHFIDIGNIKFEVQEDDVPKDVGCGDDDSSCRKNIGVNTEMVSEIETTKVIEDLKKKVEELEKHKEALLKVFSPTQIMRLENPEIGPIWSVEDVSEAISLYSAGPNAYQLMLNKGYPFPSLSVIEAWSKKIVIRPGIVKTS